MKKRIKKKQAKRNEQELKKLKEQIRVVKTLSRLQDTIKRT
nr:MAG TPA: hypothetical protein [Caudoviricetes sp.]